MSDKAFGDASPQPIESSQLGPRGCRTDKPSHCTLNSCPIEYVTIIKWLLFYATKFGVFCHRLIVSGTGVIRVWHGSPRPQSTPHKGQTSHFCSASVLSISVRQQRDELNQWSCGKHGYWTRSNRYCKPDNAVKFHMACLMESFQQSSEVGPNIRVMLINEGTEATCPESHS